MCIVIICLPGCDVKNFEINLIYLTKKSRQKIEYLETKKSF